MRGGEQDGRSELVVRATDSEARRWVEGPGEDRRVMFDLIGQICQLAAKAHHEGSATPVCRIAPPLSESSISPFASTFRLRRARILAPHSPHPSLRHFSARELPCTLPLSWTCQCSRDSTVYMWEWRVVLYASYGKGSEQRGSSRLRVIYVLTDTGGLNSYDNESNTRC